jgi:hypothetical protein
MLRELPPVGSSLPVLGEEPKVRGSAPAARPDRRPHRRPAVAVVGSWSPWVADVLGRASRRPPSGDEHLLPTPTPTPESVRPACPGPVAFMLLVPSYPERDGLLLFVAGRPLVQSLVVTHQAEDCFGGQLRDVGGGEGGPRDIGRSPGDPHLVPPSGMIALRRKAGGSAFRGCHPARMAVLSPHLTPMKGLRAAARRRARGRRLQSGTRRGAWRRCFSRVT